MMIRRIIAAALVAAATPLAASAQTCLQQADLNAGITLSNTSVGTTIEHQMTSNGLAVTTIIKSGSDTFRAELLYRHPLALAAQSDTLNATYVEPVSGLDNLAAQRQWSSAVELTSGSNDLGTAQHLVQLTGQGSFEISSCSYDVWQTDHTITYDDGFAVRTRKIYAPSLGLIVGEYVLNSDYAPIGGFLFDQITAE